MGVRSFFIGYFFLLLPSILFSCSNQYTVPLFPCSSHLDHPYGIVASFSQPFWDQPFQESLLSIIDSANIDMVRNDLWLPYTSDFIHDELEKTINNVVAKNDSLSMPMLATLFVGRKDSRPWNNKEIYEECLKYYIEKYGSSIHNWEVFNEVDLIAKVDDVPMDSIVSNYLQVLPHTYNSIKSSDEDAIVLSTGISNVKVSFLDKLSAAGGYLFFDVLNMHCYDLPENLSSYFEHIKVIMDRDGWEKPVWITEYGLPTEQQSEDAIGYNEQKEAQQAQWVARAYLISYAYGIDKMFWYSIHSRNGKSNDSENHYGLLHYDLSPKPGYYAYKTLTTMCPSGSTRPTLIQQEDSYLSVWKTPKGKRVWAIWNSKKEKKFDLVIKGKCTFYDHLGNKLKKPESYGQGVIYIVGAKSVTLE